MTSWEIGNRTPIKGFKGLCPTVRRSPNINTYNSAGKYKNTLKWVIFQLFQIIILLYCWKRGISKLLTKGNKRSIILPL